ncbi:(2Fe-2S)-binding protein [Novosphingobium soli]|uniref:(2Fe-2S)-binding protein n=1 Tax=Novosphingobium soli TaxID=574956 RepID=A0ABV6CV36_9SPHN
MSISLSINGEHHDLDAPGDMPLLWALREVAGLTGTKYGCGIGVCGACTVHLDGAAERSCLLPVGEVGARAVTTIEGLGGTGLHPVQQAWVAADIPQCGYCQPGFVMQVADLLANNPGLGDDEIVAAVSNVCRCGTYPRMRGAIAEARAAMTAKS